MDYAEVYTQLHEEAGEKWFSGSTIKRYVNDIAELVNGQNPRNILDYGSGKGFQYLVSRLHEQWGGLLPHCYDIGVRQLSQRPAIKFDGIVCTDVLEHIEREDVPAVLDDIFGFLTVEDRPKFIFFSIACRPDVKAPPADKGAHKHKKLPDGRDLHLTIEQPDWWISMILLAVQRAMDNGGVAQLKVRARFELPDGRRVREEIL